MCKKYNVLDARKRVFFIVMELLEKAGRKRGFLMRGAQVDTQRMARVLLDEFRGGKLGRFTLETVEDAQ